MLEPRVLGSQHRGHMRERKPEQGDDEGARVHTIPFQRLVLRRRAHPLPLGQMGEKA